MTKKALEACMKTATEAYEQAQNDVIRGYRTKQQIYGPYFSALYAIEGIVDALCTSDEKVMWTELTDKQHKHIRKLLKM